MTKDKDQEPHPADKPERVIRGGEGEVVGYWFPEDFWAYEDHLMKHQASLLARVRAVPMGTDIPRELWLEMRSTFAAFAESLGRKHTDFDTSMSVFSAKHIAQGGTSRDKTHH